MELPSGDIPCGANHTAIWGAQVGERDVSEHLQGQGWGQGQG